ncbi:META domain-containing protein [Martelella soudanensis]|uniref:META domain-containing protein n=1 Tax=unclassified Martelella TaxID=2629616 RepID=UPI0015DD9E73|nr:MULTISPECIES: META domain-containing protein [unclassified Martelella]
MSRSVLTLLASLLAATTAHAQDMRSISGEALIRERMALPDDAELVVEARGFRNALLATESAEANGQQVPWPFTLAIPAGVEANLSAAIRIDGANRWVSAPAAIAAGSDDIDLGEIMLTADTPAAFKSVYRCGDTRLEAGFQGEEAVIETDDRIYRLAPAISADGAKYQSDDGDNMFWSKGDNALVTLDGKALPECIGVPAGADKQWTAQGNEPGWRAVIAGDRITLDMNYGEDRLDLRLPEPEVVDGAYRYGFDQYALAFSVRAGMCQDDMSGRLFPQSVELKTATGTLTGCGGDTFDLLTGPEWSVDAIDGSALDDAADRPSFAISDEGQIFGATGCNRFTGAFSVNGEGGIAIGPLATTRMACGDAAMKQERSFLEALGASEGFGFGPDGALVLTSGTETLVEASR